MLSNIIREGRILLLAVAASVIAANVAASDGGRDNISPSVGDVLLEATDTDPIRVLVSKFHQACLSSGISGHHYDRKSIKGSR